MITSVRIKNLRGIHTGALEGMTPLVVLVGPNSSGKSTILDALLIGAGQKPGASAGYVVRRRAGLRHGARWLLWRGAQEDSGAIEVRTAQGRTYWRAVQWSDQLQFEDLRRQLLDQGASGPFSAVEVNSIALSPDSPFRVANSFPESPDGWDRAYGLAVVASDNTYASTEARDADSPLDVWMVDPRFGHLLSELYSRIVERGRRQAVRDLVAAIVPGLEAIEILTEHNDPRLHLTFADSSVPVALAGDGVQALVRLSLELASRPGGTVLLEEPEAHQHPAAIWASAQGIVEGVRRGLQIILSTHSLELLDALLSALKDDELGLLSLYRLKLAGGELRHSRLEGSEVRLSREAIGDDLR
ncbi:AAA family ATPase [Sorangium sp. So ce327]|uniref:AAA family ATPase n=1 Tax=unclassified Sorangium TaxID=2621164 RepID=UPI003F5FEF22